MKFGVEGEMKSRTVFASGIIVLTLLLTGCAHDSQSVQFYRLNADSGVDRTHQVPVVTQGPVIGLGPIRIPEYLNRPQMVVAITDNQYQLSEDHRWAERLDLSLIHI